MMNNTLRRRNLYIYNNDPSLLDCSCHLLSNNYNLNDHNIAFYHAGNRIQQDKVDMYVYRFLFLHDMDNDIHNPYLNLGTNIPLDMVSAPFEQFHLSNILLVFLFGEDNQLVHNILFRYLYTY